MKLMENILNPWKNQMILLLLNIVILILIILFGEQIIHRYFILNKYKSVLDLLDYFINKGYEVIYNDQIIGYTASGQRVIPDDEMETIERNYIKLTLELMGSKNVKIFIHFFGSRTAMIHNMLLFVRKELNQDALAKMIQSTETETENKIGS